MAEPQGFIRPTNWNIYTPAEKAKEYARQGFTQDSNGNWVKMGNSARRRAADKQEAANKQAAAIKRQDETLKKQNYLNDLIKIRENNKRAMAATHGPLNSNRDTSMASKDPAVQPILEAEKARNALKMQDARDSSKKPEIQAAEQKVQEANKKVLDDLVKNPIKPTVAEQPKDEPTTKEPVTEEPPKEPETNNTEDNTQDNTQNTDNNQGNDNDQGKEPSENKGNGSSIPLSESFYRGITSSLRNKPQGNLSDAKAATASAQANQAQKTAANRQMEAQQAAQIANRNEYAEAGKVASMQNDAKNVQNIQNREGLSGSAAAALRETTTPDVASERARQDQQRTLASSLREKGDIYEAEANANRGLAQEYALKSRDYDEAMDRTGQLSRGEGSMDSGPMNTFKGKLSNAWDDFRKNKDDIFDEDTNDYIPAPEDTPEGAVIPSDKNIKSIRDCLSDLRMKYIKEDWDKSGQIGPEDFEFLLKKLGKFKHDDREYDPFNEDDWADDKDQSVLKAYADHIKNYLYTYKPEATQVDSKIDPNEEHIGPMAQDIEQVNPACVKEDENGIKSVDTARLAMMNAGAIGDLARQMQELLEKLKALGV